MGADPPPAVLEIAERLALERSARIVHSRPGRSLGGLAATGSFQRRNFALARDAAEAYLQSVGVPLSERAVEEAAASTTVAGRMHVLQRDPLTVLDGAHNPDAVVALTESLGEILGGGPLVLVLGVLEDKDAASMLATLLPLCERAWFTAPPSSRALSPAALQSLARQLSFEAVSCEPSPAQALVQAQAWARAHGGDVLVTGSIYLVGALLDQHEPDATLSVSEARPGSSGR